jgi:hypothetical protein
VIVVSDLATGEGQYAVKFGFHFFVSNHIGEAQLPSEESPIPKK